MQAHPMEAPGSLVGTNMRLCHAHGRRLTESIANLIKIVTWQLVERPKTNGDDLRDILPTSCQTCLPRAKEQHGTDFRPAAP